MPVRSLVLLGAIGAAVAQGPNPLSLFTYSRDSAAGFEDELLDVFRRELAKHVESFTEVAYSRDEAVVSVQFLGAGDLEVELTSDDGPVRYVWRSDEKARRVWALVHVRQFSKEFSVEGSGGRDLSRLAKSISEWIRSNSAAIREGRAPKPGTGDNPGGMRP